MTDSSRVSRSCLRLGRAALGRAQKRMVGRPAPKRICSSRRPARGRRHERRSPPVGSCQPVVEAARYGGEVLMRGTVTSLFDLRPKGHPSSPQVAVRSPKAPQDPTRAVAVSSRMPSGPSMLGGLLLTVVLASNAAAQVASEEPAEGVRGDVRRQSALARLVPAEMVEQQAVKQYQKVLAEAQQKQTIAPEHHGQVIRLRAIAQRLIPFATDWNPRASAWTWEVNLLASNEINAWCMAGGKIAFYSRILYELQLTDDEVAAVMGHEIAHALREHSRKHLAESVATNLGANAVSAVLGLHTLGNKVLSAGANLLSLKFNRSDESEADVVGMELAARAGYDPRAGVTLFTKMTEASGGANRPPEYRSSHPSGERRIQQIEAILPRVMPLFERAAKPPRVYGPPPPVAQK